MRYVRYCILEDAKNRAYRIYVTDSLKFIAENTAHSAGGSAYKLRFAELIRTQPKETRTGDEIIDGIRGKLKSLEN